MKIGFIGLGKMGRVMAPHLAPKARQLIGFDPNWQMPDDSPVQRADTLSDIASCELIFTMLPDGAVVLQVISHLLEAGSNALFVDMSSCHPDTSAQLDQLLAPSGRRALDAPVSGGVAKADKGQLMIMAGGSAADFGHAAPYLNLMGTAAHIGPGGAGYAMKALNNYVSAAGLVSSFQALATAQKFGITPHAFQQIINGSTGRNNTTEVKIDKFVIPKTYDSGFALNLMAKDVAIASDIITQNGFTLPLNQPLADYLKQVLMELGGDPDHTEIYRHLENLATAAQPKQNNDR